MQESDLGGGDDLTLRINFTGEGVGMLRERVKEKLKEFMGDCTDDTLAEYVLVLLRNGRSKGEARKELNVFLGDESVSFVSWLWDHLSSNLHLFVQPNESFPDDVAKTKPSVNKLSRRCSSETEHVSGSMQTDSEYKREMPTQVSRKRRNREWKGLVPEMESFSLQSFVTENFHLEEKTHHRTNLVRRCRSPRPQAHRKRSRQDERQPTKRGTTSQLAVGAPSRLLQSAVRDAVRTVQQTNSRTEPTLKQLQHVVSTSTTCSLLEERPQTTRSAARVSGAVAAVFKAAAEAAQDVIKVRCSGNVFGRQGHDMEVGEYEDSDKIPGSSHLDYFKKSEYDGEFAGDMAMLDRDTGLSLDSASDGGCGDIGIVRHQALDASHSGSSATKDKNSLMVQYSLARDADELVKGTRIVDQEPPATAAGNASRKIVNISVNVNTWKPPHYETPRNVADVENLTTGEKGDVSVGKPNVRLLKGNNTAIPVKESDVACADVQKEVQKTVSSIPGSYTTTRPSDGIDSRIVFVSNVHFAATKDTLSRHFNKFGEVLKVIIVTDAATGQPKGSAYVEFLRKESAELALSLDGTSFMSRILKVVRRSSAHHEAAPLMVWPRMARPSAFASRLGRVPFPRGALASAFRARLPIKSGARSLQWKRGAPTAEGAKTLQNVSLPSGNTLLSPTGQNLT